MTHDVTISPDWKSFAQFSWNSESAALLRALGFQLESIPAEGRPRTFRGPGCWATRHPGGTVTIWRQPRLCEDNTYDPLLHSRSQTVGPSLRELENGTADQVVGDLLLKLFHLPDGTPSGLALRQWLRLWGWIPPAKKASQSPPNIL